MMQFQLLVALRANLDREIDRAEQTAQRDPHPSQQDVSAVVELPFSSLLLNPKLIRYLQLTLSQVIAIQDVMSRERQKTVKGCFVFANGRSLLAIQTSDCPVNSNAMVWSAAASAAGR
jgi:hypothetical protein